MVNILRYVIMWLTENTYTKVYIPSGLIMAHITSETIYLSNTIRNLLAFGRKFKSHQLQSLLLDKDRL